DQCAHSVEIVLADEDYRQLPERGHVERLVERALRQRAIAKESTYDLGLFLVGNGEAEPDRERQAAADDRIAAHEAQVRIEQMHRAPAAVRDAALLAEQLSHHLACRRALGEAMAMLAIGRDHVILVVEGEDRTDRDRFLAGVEMAEAGDLA